MGLMSWIRELAIRHRARELIAAHGAAGAREVVARLGADARLDPDERAFLQSVSDWMARRG
jgi:hypothetical protein